MIDLLVSCHRCMYIIFFFEIFRNLKHPYCIDRRRRILILATKLNVSMGINNFLWSDLCPIFINGIIALLSLK